MKDGKKSVFLKINVQEGVNNWDSFCENDTMFINIMSFYKHEPLEYDS